MKDNKGNNININGNIENSEITFNQTQDSNKPIERDYIEYKIDQDDYKEKSTLKSYKKRRILMISIFLSALGTIADITGLLQNFNINISFGGYLFIVIILLIIIAVNGHDSWMVSLNPEDEERYKDGKWYKRINKNKISIYSKKANCTYPKCNGEISIIPAPPKEIHNHDYVGICSVGGIQHTYTYARNGIGLKRFFDWSPVEEQPQK